MKWKWIDADCTSVTTAEGTLTLKGLFIPLFIEQLLMNMTGTVNTLMLGHYADDAVAAVGAANQVIGFLYTFYAVFSGGASVVISHRLGAGSVYLHRVRRCNQPDLRNDTGIFCRCSHASDAVRNIGV